MTTIAATKATDLLTLDELGGEGVRQVFETAAAMKATPGEFRGVLSGKSVIMLFEKPSLRTRVSFEVGVARLGGHAMFYDHASVKIGERESVKDYAKNLERWVDCIVARVFKHSILDELAFYSSKPVVNALSDMHHPCQALADFFTLREHVGSDEALKLAYVGDGNNVAHSLVLAGAMLGAHLTIVTPPGFEPQFDVLRGAMAHAQKSGAKITVTNDVEAVEGHDAVYTDVWVSMGQASQQAFRLAAFQGYQVDAELMALASKGRLRPAYFMHCLPANRNIEVTDEVIDSASSVVYDQAENRMHVQMALLAKLMGQQA
ncbi:MAG: ornithine carbamoyltransferase [Phycisphaeraceae bacterium]|nr:MAG: ornithine carbamoyltransferase [Phycisphaeraceae bacterium]